MCPQSGSKALKRKSELETIFQAMHFLAEVIRELHVPDLQMANPPN